jgi:hypothetical protein
MKTKMKKAAIELSSGFLVGIILGILLLGLGLVFAMNLINGANGIIAPGLPNYFDSLVKDCVQKGEKICVPEIKKEIPVNRIESFGVVINNVADAEKKFKPNVRFSRGILEDESEISYISPNKLKEWTNSDEKFREIQLEDKEYYTLAVPIKVPLGTKPGTYVFNINVCYDSDSNEEAEKCPNSEYPSLYGTTQQISVTVP